jgi:putative aldouronate transport system permease protein
MVKRTKSEISFDVVNIVFMLFLCVIMLYPFLYVVSRSVMPDAERALRPLALIPKSFDWDGYEYIFSSGSMVISGYKVSVKRVIIGTAMSLFFESMMAYTLSKKYYPFRTAITVLIAFTMWFNAGLIPFYLTVKTLGLTNRFMSLVIPRLMSVWYIIIMRNFFAQIPDSLEESARIDGANDLTVLFRVVLPLSTPVLATVALFHIVTYWNEWFHAMLFISDRKKQPVMIILRQILAQANQASLNENIRDNFDAPPTLLIQMATTVVVAFPIIIAYPLFQKYFVKGMLIGSIKG